jgi:DNA repair photolyase
MHRAVLKKRRTEMLNDDGAGVKGATCIYAPAGQAGEYAPLACNPYRGCGHKCAYCYVPTGEAEGVDPDVQSHNRLGAVRNLTRAEFDAGAVVKKDFLARLEKEARKYQEHGVTDQVLLSFTTDPYPPAHHIETRRTLEILRDHGLAFCTLTKGGSRALRDIDLFRPDRDAFASSLTSLDAAFSRKWERAAADPDDRIATLRAFHERGIFTWVSLEPVLDVEASLAIVDATYEFVDLYKVGRANYLKLTKTTDWRSYTARMIEKLHRLGRRHYVKRDLQPFLPSGYANPLRAQQHH